MDSQPDRTQSVEQQLQEQLLSGVQGNTRQAGKIRDILRDMFDPNDYVTVANPFDYMTGWAYVDPAEERMERPDKTTKRMHFGKPKTRVLKPGEQVVIHGWEAYIALGRMFKEHAQAQGDNMIIVLTSQGEIDKFLNKAYKGVFDPNQQINAINAQAAAQDIEDNRPPAPAPVADPLGFGEPEQVTPPAPQEPPVESDETVSQSQDSDTTTTQTQGDEPTQNQ